jgi:hypothetical protein
MATRDIRKAGPVEVAFGIDHDLGSDDDSRGQYSGRHAKAKYRDPPANSP